MRSLVLFVLLLCLPLSSTAEEQCPVVDFNGKQLSVERKDFMSHLVLKSKNRVIQKVRLPEEGMGPHCLHLKTFPEYNVVVMEFNVGGAGTQTMTSEDHLLVFRWKDRRLRKSLQKVLRELTDSGSGVQVSHKHKYSLSQQGRELKLVVRNNSTKSKKQYSFKKK